jgi:hypothetical protein
MGSRLIVAKWWGGTRKSFALRRILAGLTSLFCGQIQ